MTTKVVQIHETAASVGEKGVVMAVPPTRSLSGVTQLMVACQRGNVADVKALLQNKPAMAHERDRTGKTALHYCSENQSISCADEMVLAEPKLVDVGDEEGYTILHLAIINSNRMLVRFLISKEANVNAIDREKHSVIHWAAVCGEVECMDLLLEAGANPSTADMHGAYPLHYAAQMCGPNSELGHDTQVGLNVLRRLLSHGVNVNVRDQDGRQPLLWAASAGSSDAMLALVNSGAAVNGRDKDGLSALHCAASRGHSECLETLLTLCGVEVDTEDNNGCTSLFYAVTLGHADCTSLLLRQGAHSNHQDQKGRTPAHCGAAKGQLETLKILEKHSADLWKQNTRGDLPLHEAVQSGRKELVLWLLAKRPSATNLSNNEGRTCLHIAAINNNVEMCKVLMDKGSDVNPVMRTAKGQMMTPLDAALFRSNRGCANYLQLHGGMPAHKLHDKALVSISYRGLETQEGLTPEPEDRLSLGSKNEGIQTDTSSMQQEKSIQTMIQQDSDHDNLDAAPSAVDIPAAAAAVEQDGGNKQTRQLAKISEGNTRYGGKKKRGGGDRDNTSVTSDNSSLGHKDSGFSDNNRGGGHSDADDSDVLSSPTEGITFINNGTEVVQNKRRQRRRHQRVQIQTGPADSESELSERSRLRAGTTHQVGGPSKTATSRKTVKDQLLEKPETSFFRPKSEDRLPGVNNNTRVRVHQKERRIFQELMELNRVRLNADRNDEEFIVRKLVDGYRHQGLTVGNVRFMGPYTFHGYEKYLFDQLRQLSGSSVMGGNGNSSKLKGALYEADRKNGKLADDPKECTHRTYHCHHATHTYMGVPCVAYLRNNKPLLPKINYKPNSSKSVKEKQDLATVNPKEPVMLEIKHAGQVQKFSLPTGKLDKNKKYQLTFTIGPTGAPEETKKNGPNLKPLKSV